MRECYICGSTHRVSKLSQDDKLYCGRHFVQMKKHGKISKTRADPNEIILYESHAEIILYDKNGEPIANAKISLDKIEKVKKYRWWLSPNGYVYASENDKEFSLHRFIINAQDGTEVDHRDRNTLNNLNENLRLSNHHLNGMNIEMFSHNTSGFKGVYWDKSRNKWMASIKVNQKNIYLGRFDNFEDAKEARIEAEIKYFNEFSTHFKEE